MGEFLIKVKHSDQLSTRDIINDIRKGLKLIVNSGDPECEYLHLLGQVKVVHNYKRKRIRAPK